MISSLINTGFVCELIAMLAGFFLLTPATGYWSLYRIPLAVTIIGECIGWYLIYVLKADSNVWVYNLLLLINGLFSIRFLVKANQLYNKSKGYIVYLFALFWIINAVFIQRFKVYDYYSEIFVDLILIVYSLFFFYSILASPGYRSLLPNEYFWFTCSCLFGGVGGAVLYIFTSSISEFEKMSQLNVYQFLNGVLNIMVYGCLIIAFICRKKNTRLL